jgi:predicted HAD superfamily Cof-like phosphohydrolase
MVKIRTQEEINASKKKHSFRSKSIFDQQADFMKACGQTVDKYNPKQALLYLDLIHEEFNELTLDAESDAEIADAIIDTIVVLVGYGLSHGWPMKKLWDEVMGSNMAKIDPTTGKVKKRKDGKVLKPKDWQPPNINDILLRHAAKQKV